MSRSYKHEPICKDNSKNCHKDKQKASRRFRRNIYKDIEEDLSNSRAIYKKINRDMYDIHDYICRMTIEEAKEWFKDEENFDRFWHQFIGK